MKRFTVRGTNTGFVCAYCGTEVRPLASGSVRNHCPACLASVHLDVDPGDRASDCGGELEPVSAVRDGKKGWVIVHRCRRCGAERRNRAALDDPQQPDDLDALIRLTLRPYRGP